MSSYVPWNLIGDGVADDRPAIQAALDAAAATCGIVRLPPGTFCLRLAEHPPQGQKDSALIVPAGVTLSGSGRHATTLSVPQHNVTALAVGDRVTIRALHLLGSGHPTYTVPNWQTTPNEAGLLGGLQSGVDSGTARDVTIADCRFEAFALHAIKASDASLGWRIVGNDVRACGDEGIVTLNRADAHRIEGNRVVGCGKNGIGCNGASIDILDNVCVGNGTLNGLIGWQSDVHGILFWQASAVEDADISHAAISRNRCVGNGGSGILVEAAPELRHESVRITDNHIEKNGTGLIVGVNRDGIVRGNTFRDNGGAGNGQDVVVRRGDGLTIDGNTFRHTAPTPAEASFAAITIVAQDAPAGQPARVYVHDNTMVGHRRGIYCENGADHRFVGNDLRGIADPALRLLVADGVVGSTWTANPGAPDGATVGAAAGG